MWVSRYHECMVPRAVVEGVVHGAIIRSKWPKLVFHMFWPKERFWDHRALKRQGPEEQQRAPYSRVWEAVEAFDMQSTLSPLGTLQQDGVATAWTRGRTVPPIRGGE